MGGGAPKGALAFSEARFCGDLLRTAVYIDGFNLYYWMKPLPYRWIDLKSLVLNAITKPDVEHDLVAIKYFTARVSDTRDDPSKATRQDIYFQALKASIPEFTIHFGEFRRQKKQMPRVGLRDRVGRPIWVWDTEEKGSDVNLAVELVNDAWLNLYDMAVVVSNDSDLERAVRIVKKKSRTVGVLVRGDAQVNSLRRVASFYRRLTEDDLKASLLPRKIEGTNIEIPSNWRKKEAAAKLRAAPDS